MMDDDTDTGIENPRVKRSILSLGTTLHLAASPRGPPGKSSKTRVFLEVRLLGERTGIGASYSMASGGEKHINLSLPLAVLSQRFGPLCFEAAFGCPLYDRVARDLVS